MLPELTAQADSLGIAATVTFHGHLPHPQVQQILAAANLLTFPSIREFGGGVVLEAMALGVVPMVVDYAGPGELVTAETGFAIPLGTRQQIAARMEQALADVLRDPTRLTTMAAAARRTVQDHYTWDAKAAQIIAMYRDVPKP